MNMKIFTSSNGLETFKTLMPEFKNNHRRIVRQFSGWLFLETSNAKSSFS